MLLPDFRLWLTHPRAAWIQAQNNADFSPIVWIVVIVGALVYWRTKSALLRVLLCTAAGGWLLYLGYERIMTYAAK